MGSHQKTSLVLVTTEILAGHEGVVTVAVGSLTQHLELAYNIPNNRWALAKAMDQINN